MKTLHQKHLLVGVTGNKVPAYNHVPIAPGAISFCVIQRDVHV